jgi:hypothetical protein
MKPVVKYGSERDQALKQKSSFRGNNRSINSPENNNFGSRNPDGSMYGKPGKKSKHIRPS